MRRWSTIMFLAALSSAGYLVWHLYRPVQVKRMLITRADSQHTCYVTFDQPLDATKPYVVRKNIPHRRLVIVQEGKVVGKSSHELCTTVTEK